MEQQKKVKKIKRQARILNNKQRQLDLEKYILEYSELKIPDEIMNKSEILVDQLELEEDLVKK